jgi:hypothetical protein
MTHGRIERGDVLNFFEYEKVREEMRRRVIALKCARRVAVGPYVSFVFENRDTLLFQIQEMCRVERITDDAKIQAEIDVYGALLPRPGELSATLMIEMVVDHPATLARGELSAETKAALSEDLLG